MLREKARLVFARGFTRLKLYLQVGLPTETDADVENIVRTVADLREIAVAEGRRLGRVAQLVPSVNAFIAVLAEQARARAAEADRELAQGRDRGALHGIPVSIKDIIDIEGTATTAASQVRSDHVATEDAPIVARLRAAVAG